MLLPLLESGLEAVMQFSRTPLLCFLLLALVAGSGVAQNPKPESDAGYIPVLAPEGKKKKKGDEITQAPPRHLNCPPAVTTETARLAYQVSPLSSKGLLSQQTRDALKALLRIQSRTHRETASFRRGLGRSAAHR